MPHVDPSYIVASCCQWTTSIWVKIQYSSAILCQLTERAKPTFAAMWYRRLVVAGYKLIVWMAEKHGVIIVLSGVLDLGCPFMHLL